MGSPAARWLQRPGRGTGACSPTSLSAHHTETLRTCAAPAGPRWPCTPRVLRSCSLGALASGTPGPGQSSQLSSARPRGEAPAAVQGSGLLLSDCSQASPKPPARQVEPGSPAPDPASQPTCPGPAPSAQRAKLTPAADTSEGWPIRRGKEGQRETWPLPGGAGQPRAQPMTPTAQAT